VLEQGAAHPSCLLPIYSHSKYMPTSAMPRSAPEYKHIHFFTGTYIL